MWQTRQISFCLINVTCKWFVLADMCLQINGNELNLNYYAKVCLSSWVLFFSSGFLALSTLFTAKCNLEKSRPWPISISASQMHEFIISQFLWNTVTIIMKWFIDFVWVFFNLCCGPCLLSCILSEKMEMSSAVKGGVQKKSQRFCHKL